MNILVIGLGSMGRRRIKLMGNMEGGHTLAGVDTSPERRELASQMFGIASYESLESALAHSMPDAAFVCTSPASHGGIALTCLRKGISIFTEINLLSDWYQEALTLVKKTGVRIFLSSTFLYRGEMEYIKKYTQDFSRLDYIYHSGQYLPDWHPWESYKNFFVAHPKTNGCREIFAIELPWLIDTFGDITNFHVVKSKNSHLDIDYPDNYLVTFEHESGNKGIFCVDVISRKAVRKLEIYSEDMHLTWNGTPYSLSTYDIENKVERNVEIYDSVTHENNYAASIIENAYQDEIKNFFNYLSGTEAPRYSLEKDEKVLRLIDEIEGVRP